MEILRTRRHFFRFLPWMIVLVWSGFVSAIGDETSGVIGFSALLRCQVQIEGDFELFWLGPDGDVLAEDGESTNPSKYDLIQEYDEWNLEVKKLEVSDEGTYSCVVDIGTQELKKFVHLSVHIPPSIDHNTEDKSVVAGSDVTLECHASGNPDPTITWHKYLFTGDLQDLEVEGEQLTLKNVSKEDSATYRCVAQNGVSPIAIHDIILSVQFAPEVHLPHPYLSQQEGHDTMLSCMVTANADVSSNDLYWEKGGSRLEDSEKHRTDEWDVGEFTKNLVLWIRGLEPDDFGEYVCVAKNEYGEDSGSMHLYEWQTGSLKVLSTPKDVISTHGEDIRVNCTLEGITSKDNLIWWHTSTATGTQKIFESNPPSQDILEDSNVLRSSKHDIIGHYDLVVKDVRPEDAGVYTCEVVQHRNYTAKLTVVEIPECSLNTSTINTTAVEEGGRAELTCELAYVGPEPYWQVDWHHEEVKLSSVNHDEDDRLVRIVSMRAHPEDAGVYRCVISNKEPVYSAGCSVELDVIVFEPTSKPLCEKAPVVSASSTMWIIIGATLSGLLIIMFLVIIAVMGHYRKVIQKLKEPPRPYEFIDKPPISHISFDSQSTCNTSRTSSFHHLLDPKAPRFPNSPVPEWNGNRRNGGPDLPSLPRGGGMTSMSDSSSVVTTSGIYEEITSSTTSLSGYFGQEGIEV